MATHTTLYTHIQFVLYCNNVSKFLSDDVAIISTVISSISIFLSTFTLYIFLHSSLRRVVIIASANNQSFFLQFLYSIFYFSIQSILIFNLKFLLFRPHLYVHPPTERPNWPHVVKARGSLDRFGPFLFHFSSLQRFFSVLQKINGLADDPLIPNFSQKFLGFSSDSTYDPLYPLSHIVDKNSLYLWIISRPYKN